jgi:NDP-sugar pyrophosphorylase family protein
MKAMILAAGKGTRMKTLTKTKPKALVELFGKTLLEIQIEKLKKAGFSDLIINVHHFADQIVQFVNSRNNFGINIQFSDERAQLLDTGGGIKNAQWFLKGTDPILIHNVDIVTDINLDNLIEAHKKSQAFVSLPVRKRESQRHLLYDTNNQLKGWENCKTNEKVFVDGTPSDELAVFAFSGIHFIQPEIFDFFPDDRHFSIINFYLELAKTKRILAFDHSPTGWYDIGKYNEFEKQSKDPQLQIIIKG